MANQSPQSGLSIAPIPSKGCVTISLPHLQSGKKSGRGGGKEEGEPCVHLHSGDLGSVQAPTCTNGWPWESHLTSLGVSSRRSNPALPASQGQMTQFGIIEVKESEFLPQRTLSPLEGEAQITAPRTKQRPEPGLETQEEGVHSHRLVQRLSWRLPCEGQERLLQNQMLYGFDSGCHTS